MPVDVLSIVFGKEAVKHRASEYQAARSVYCRDTACADKSSHTPSGVAYIFTSARGRIIPTRYIAPSALESVRLGDGRFLGHPAHSWTWATGVPADFLGPDRPTRTINPRMLSSQADAINHLCATVAITGVIVTAEALVSA